MKGPVPEGRCLRGIAHRDVAPHPGPLPGGEGGEEENLLPGGQGGEEENLLPGDREEKRRTLSPRERAG